MSKKRRLAGYRPLPHRNRGDCFGCGTGNDAGLRMEFFTDDRSLVSEVAIPPFLCGWNNLVHGGIISTVLDETMGWTAIYFTRRLVLTRNLSVDFLKPVFVEQPLWVEGRVKERNGERLAIVTSEMYNSKEELCARAEALFSLFTVDAARRLGFLDDELLADLEENFFQRRPE